MNWTKLLLLPGVFCLAEAVARAESPVAEAEGSSRSSRAEARRVASRIDKLIAAGYKQAGVDPASRCDDATFLRRVSLDVTGKIPVVNDVRKFLADTSAEKREQAIEKLLASPGYVNHFTSLWLRMLLPEAQTDLNKRYMQVGMYGWLRRHLANNTAYDHMVREIVALSFDQQGRVSRAVAFDLSGGTNSPLPFYLAKQGKPEEIAASISRLFLGVRLECAQCHDHPFGQWKREDFWSQAAFFAGVRGQGSGDFIGAVNEVSDRREIAIPNTERVAQARFLDGSTPRWRFKVSARTTLADWMTAKKNPFFARAAVNRMWAHLFGIGLVDPVDDLVEDNPASHPALLDMLAREFTEHDFDIKFLIRAITMSQTYQLSSVTDPTKPSEVRTFARMPVKGLTGEQLYGSFRVATGLRDNYSFREQLYTFGTARQTFLETFAEQEKAIENHTSIPQALTMMNAQLMTNATHPERGEVLGAILTGPFPNHASRIEALYLAALSRKPRTEETAKFVRYVERGGASGTAEKALADVFWALLNSTEFRFNH